MPDLDCRGVSKESHRPSLNSILYAEVDKLGKIDDFRYIFGTVRGMTEHREGRMPARDTRQEALAHLRQRIAEKSRHSASSIYSAAELTGSSRLAETWMFRAATEVARQRRWQRFDTNAGAIFASPNMTLDDFLNLYIFQRS